MSLLNYKANNHPQQVGKRGATDEIDDRGTPWDFFGPLHEAYGFTLDAAAAAHNAKCERYFDRSSNGLTQSWAGEVVWCNPPYSGLGDWLEKAWAEWSSAVPPRKIVMLLPANRTEQAWWQDHVEPYRDRESSPLRTQFLRGRLRFIKPGQTEIKPNERPPFGCVLLVWSS